MKKSLTSLFALAFALMFGAVHFANAEEPAAKTNGGMETKKEEKKETKHEKKAIKKKATKKHVKKEEKKEEMKEGAPAAPAK